MKLATRLLIKCPVDRAGEEEFEPSLPGPEPDVLPPGDSPATYQETKRIRQWGRGDSNPHALRHQILSLARLPIPALPREYNMILSHVVFPTEVPPTNILAPPSTKAPAPPLCVTRELLHLSPFYQVYYTDVTTTVHRNLRRR